MRGRTSVFYCAYCNMTGKPRKCPITECDKYVPRYERKPVMTANHEIEWREADAEKESAVKREETV